MSKYDEIINLPHHQSTKHPRMSNYDRAAQFSPFAALTGYDDAVKETARTTLSQIELEGEQLDTINSKMCILVKKIAECPEVEITYFIPDERKEGGRYESKRGKVRRIDLPNRQIFFVGGAVVCMDRVIDMTGEIFVDSID